MAARIAPLHRIPQKWRTLALQGAVALVLVAFGVVIGHTLAWIIIAICATVIVLFGTVGFYEGQQAPRQARAADAVVAPEQAWRPSEHGLLGNATHYTDQVLDERMRGATQPDP